MLTANSITGSSQGIGREIAVDSARNGANLVLHHIGDAQSIKDIAALIDELNAARNTTGSEAFVDVGLDITNAEAGQRYRT